MTRAVHKTQSGIEVLLDHLILPAQRQSLPARQGMALFFLAVLYVLDMHSLEGKVLVMRLGQCILSARYVNVIATLVKYFKSY